MSTRRQAVRYYYQARGVIKNHTILLTVFVLLMTACVKLSAQTNKPPFNNSLFIEGKISLDSLIRYVHIHTGMRFSFNSGKIKSSKIISFPKGKYSLNQVLLHIKKTTSLYYALFKGYVILQDNPLKENKDKIAISSTYKQQSININKRTYNKKIKSEKYNSFTAKVIQPLSKYSTNLKPIIVAASLPQTDSIFSNKLIDSSGNINVSYISKDSILNNSRQSIKSIVTAKENPTKEDRPKWFMPYSQIGLFVSEIMYTNLSFEIGIRPVHFIFSLGTNYQISGWKIGIGSIFKSTEQSQWQANASVSFLKRNLPSGDTIFKTLTVKGKLYNGAIQWGKDFSSKWQIKIGSSFNILRTEYYYKDKLTPVSGLPQPVDNFENSVYLVRPPFLLKNTFDINKYSNIKTWIGINIGIYYKLF